MTKYAVGTPVAYVDQNTKVIGIIYDAWIATNQHEESYDAYYIEWQDEFDRTQMYTEHDIEDLVRTYKALEDAI